MTDFSQGPPRSPSRHSFTAYYKANISTVVRILGKIGVHPPDISDIAQQVFLKIFNNWDKSEAVNLDVSLDTICRQQAANHYRLHRHRLEQPEPNVGEAMPSDQEDAQSQLEHHELDQIVQRILEGMSPEFRDLLVRREFQKESLESIAMAHNIARNTATARIAEAKRIFRLRAERMLGDKRSWLLLAPCALHTHEFNAAYSDEFMANMQDQVWRGLAPQVGFSDEDLSEGMEREADLEPPQSRSRRHIQANWLPQPKSLIGFLTKPVCLLGAGVLTGIAGASLWPHAYPAIARRMPSLHVVVLEHEAPRENAGLSIPSVPSVVDLSTAKTFPAPMVDHELRSLQRARTLIAQGNYAEALAALRQHEKEFPRSENAAIRSQYIALAEEGLRRMQKVPPASKHF
jgi:RNA polymerase sigma factor (sigma-70 family)